MKSVREAGRALDTFGETKGVRANRPITNIPDLKRDRVVCPPGKVLSALQFGMSNTKSLKLKQCSRDVSRLQGHTGLARKYTVWYK